ncbi:MAG: GNAT family N-acetyltransferase [Saprospiraceae bacterium]
MHLDQIKNVFTAQATKLAFCIGTQSYSYEEWLSYICGIRELLRKESPKTHFIGLAAYDDIETYAAILALWAEGYAFVPLSPKSPAERNAGVMKQVESNVVLSSRMADEKLIRGSDIQWLTISNLKSDGEVPDLSKIEKDTILCMLFTSGSTGIPKGVPMTKKNIDSTLVAFFEEGYQLDEEDRFLQMFELTFDMSMISYLPAWCIGASVHTVDSEGIKYLNAFKVMQEQEVTFVTTVPSTLQLLRPYFSQIHLPKVKYSLQGGEPFSVDLAKIWMDCIPNAMVVNLSGPCETTMACMSYNLNRDFSKNKHHNNILAFGRPWSQTAVLLLNENGEECTIGEEGELCFAGEHVMDGYWKMPEKNEVVFFTKNIRGKTLRFYRTGDMAFQDEDGIYFSIGRKDVQYKVQGYKVELGDIEQHAQRFLKSGNAVAHVERNVKGLLEINLFVDAEGVNEKALLEYLSGKLPSYMQPRSVRVLEKFPRTISGKLDRKRFASIFAGADFKFVSKRELAKRVEQNLFATYRAAANSMNTPIWKKGNLEAIDAAPSYWPKTTFGSPDPSEIRVLAAEILANTIPQRLILKRPSDPESLYPKMENLGFRYLISWPGMALDLYNNTFTKDGTNSALIKTEAGLKEWFDIVNAVLFTQNKMTWESAKAIWSAEEFCFYGLLKKEKMVAIALTFRAGKGVGVYMVAVDEAHRRQGYAKALMQEVLVDAKAAGCTAAYLQATKQGFGLYKGLGFLTVCDFDIFRLGE